LADFELGAVVFYLGWRIGNSRVNVTCHVRSLLTIKLFYRSSPGVDSAEIQDIVMAEPHGDRLVQVMKYIILRLLLAVVHTSRTHGRRKTKIAQGSNAYFRRMKPPLCLRWLGF
jgi:hypothetical protein